MKLIGILFKFDSYYISVREMMIMKWYLGTSKESDTNSIMKVWFVENKWNGLAFEDFENEDELYDRAFDTIPQFGTKDGSLVIEVISSDYELEELEDDED